MTLAQHLIRALRPLGRLSGTLETDGTSVLQLRFFNAGLRFQHGPLFYLAAKSVLALLLPLLLWGALLNISLPFLTRWALFIGVSAMGYRLPNMVLRFFIARRQTSIARALPELLDLLVLCVEAGLSLEQALARAGREIILQSRPLAEELLWVGAELTAGSTRARALRHWAMRVGLEPLDSLVALLAQAERFGTRIADALRAQSNHLRMRQRQKVETAAAQVGLKLLFPLIFCLFPGLLLVLVGPAFISLMHVLAA
jgi:tight adherence protein C